MQALSAIVVLSLMSAQVALGSDVHSMCQHYQGSLVEFHVKKVGGTPESWTGLPHVFCETSLGVLTNNLSTTVFIDAGHGQSLTTPSVASTLIKYLPAIDVQRMMKGLGAASPAAILCERLGGNAVGDYNRDYYFVNDKDSNQAIAFCVFGDGSFAQSWTMYYAAISPFIQGLQGSVYATLRQEITDDMILPHVDIDPSLLLRQINVLECKTDSDCASYTNPCNANQNLMVCNAHQGICVAKEETPITCESNDDCEAYPFIQKNYAQVGEGFCFPSVCSFGVCRQGFL